jgi:hypothetical protein
MENDADGGLLKTSGQNSTVDQVLGGITVVLVALGLIGNITAFLYFWGGKRQSVHNMLYLTITAVDICTCLSAASVTVVLLNDRDPFLLGDPQFCILWYVILGFSVRMSMFLVVLISVARTFNIVVPFHILRRHHLVYAMLVYGAWLLVVDGVAFGLNIMYPQYSEHHAFCLPFPPNMSQQDPGPAEITWWVLIEAEFLLPSVAVFFSFTVTVVSLYKRRSQRSDRDLKYRRVSVTVALFTAVFLVCNIPCFLYQLYMIVYRIGGHIAAVLLDPSETGTFYWYGSLVSQLLASLLNAALNPFLYLLRMTPMRKWMCLMVGECVPSCGVVKRASSRLLKLSSTTDQN